MSEWSIVLIRLPSCFFFFSSRRRHTRWPRDWSSDVCSSDLEISSCDAEDVDRAVAAAGASFAAGVWSRMHPADRREVLMRLVALLEENLEDLALMESIDAGKPITDCREFDLPDTIGSIRWYAEAADKVFGKT